MRRIIGVLGLLFSVTSMYAVPPTLNYAGQVRVQGKPFSGTGYVKFAFVNASGNVTYWSHDGTSTAGSEPSGYVSVQVRGGLYSLLLGNTAISGMGAIDPSLFQQYSDIHVRVWFNDGERGFQHLRPDRPFSSVPYALSAGSAGIAPGSVSLNMLGSDVQTTLSATIDRSRLSADVQADLNRTIGEDQLSDQVTEKLNRDFSIPNGTITKSLLANDVLNDLNRTIALKDLDPQVIADLNNSIAPDSISLNQLSQQVRDEINRKVTRDRLSAEVLSDINRTITKTMLSQEVLDDLNRSIETGSITREMLAQDVIYEFNNTQGGNVNFLSSLFLPYSSVPEIIVADKNFTIPENKVLVTANIRGHIKVGDYFVSHADSIGGNNHYINDVVILEGPKYLTIHEDVVSSTNFTQQGGFVGLLYDNDPQLPVILGWSGYNVPLGKRLVITSIRGGISIDDVLVNFKTTPVGQIPLIVETGSSITVHTPYNYLGDSGFTGYLIDENQSLGGGYNTNTDQTSSSTFISNGSITREMLDADLRNDLNFSAFQSTQISSNLFMPYGYDGEPITEDVPYTVPAGKVLVISTGIGAYVSIDGHAVNAIPRDAPGAKDVVIIPSGVTFNLYWNGVYGGWFSGFLFDEIEGIIPVAKGTANNDLYTVPLGKKLVVTSSVGGLNGTTQDGKDIGCAYPLARFPPIIPQGSEIFNSGGPAQLLYGFSGYLIDQNQSLGGGLISSADQASVTGSIENGSITRDKLSGEILAELSASVSEEELNSTISAKLGSIPPTNGQLLSVPVGSEPPPGYTKISDSRIDWKMVTSSNSHQNQAYTESRGKLISINESLYCLYYGGSLAFILKKYDEDSSQWLNVENASPPNNHGTNGGTTRDRGWGGRFGEKIYLVGGQGFNNDSIVSIYDTEMGTWSSGPNLPQYDSQYPPYVGEVNSSLYVISHIDSNNYRAFKLDSNSSSWTDITVDFKTTRGWGGVCLQYSNSLFFVGGSAGVIQKFDPASSEVTYVTSIPDWSNAVYNADAAFIVADKIYSYRTHGHFYSYDILNNTWTRANNEPAPSGTNSVSGHAMTIHKGIPWISGGGLTLTSDASNAGTTRNFGTYSGTFVPAVYSYTGDANQTNYVPANTSVTPNMLSDSLLKYLMPAVEPSVSFISPIEKAYEGQTILLSGQADGRFLEYQWYKNGELIIGANETDLIIEDLNSSSHEGNYTLVVKNEFGETETDPFSLQVFSDSIIQNMIWVEPGTFMMGQQDVADPVHEVKITRGYFLGRFEVTQELYESIIIQSSEDINATPSKFIGALLPVEQVSLQDAKEFIRVLNNLASNEGSLPLGWEYALPTEAQWEYACRAGTSTSYSWGEDTGFEFANYGYQDNLGQTAVVGSYSPNSWGFYDMHGNVMEWVSDIWWTYDEWPVSDPIGATSGSYHILRGGSWAAYSATSLKSAKRFTTSNENSDSTGFRLALVRAN